MSTTITLDPWSKSLESSLSQGSLPSMKRKSYALKSTFNPTSPMRTSSSHLSPNKSWEQSFSSFQASARSQCPRVHYHPWCNDCQTLMEWEPLPPISPTHKKPMPTFGDLKRVVRERSCYQSLLGTRTASENVIKKVCSMWREEQFCHDPDASGHGTCTTTVCLLILTFFICSPCSLSIRASPQTPYL